MPDVRPTASEVVFVHPLRFCEPAARGLVVPGSGARVGGRALGQAIVTAAVVSSLHERWIELQLADVAVLMGLARRRDLTAVAGERADDVPSNTIEARIVATIATGSRAQGCQLEWALRHCLALPGESRPNPIELVRSTAKIRGLLDADDRPVDRPCLDVAAADRVHSLVADLRERDPELWLAIDRAIEGAFTPWMPTGVRGLAPVRPRLDRRPRREATEYDLGDWERLNRNPPRAR